MLCSNIVKCPLLPQPLPTFCKSIKTSRWIVTYTWTVPIFYAPEVCLLPTSEAKEPQQMFSGLDKIHSTQGSMLSQLATKGLASISSLKKDLLSISSSSPLPPFQEKKRMPIGQKMEKVCREEEKNEAKKVFPNREGIPSVGKLLSLHEKALGWKGKCTTSGYTLSFVICQEERPEWIVCQIPFLHHFNVIQAPPPKKIQHYSCVTATLRSTNIVSNWREARRGSISHKSANLGNKSIVNAAG